MGALCGAVINLWLDCKSLVSYKVKNSHCLRRSELSNAFMYGQNVCENWRDSRVVLGCSEKALAQILLSIGPLFLSIVPKSFRFSRLFGLASRITVEVVPLTRGCCCRLLPAVALPSRRCSLDANGLSICLKGCPIPPRAPLVGAHGARYGAEERVGCPHCGGADGRQDAYPWLAPPRTARVHTHPPAHPSWMRP